MYSRRSCFTASIGIIRTADSKQALVADMDIYFCRPRVHMPEQCLNIFNVDTVLKQMAGKAVPTAMSGYMLRNAGFDSTFLEILINAVLVKISAGP